MEYIDALKKSSPYVRMMRIKKASSMTGKWRDIDNVFTYIASGSGDFIIDGIRYTLHTGNAIIIPPYKTHLIVSQGTDVLVQYIMHFDFFETPERVALASRDVLDISDQSIEISPKEQLLDQKVLIAEIPESERNDICRRYLSMEREFHEKRPGKGTMLKADCLALLVSTFRCELRSEERQADRDAKRTKSWIHIENAIAYISKQNMNDELDNDSIADAIGVSPNYLTKVFQQYLGMSLHRYIQNLRIERAQQVLLSGKMNVTEAAQYTGFSSVHVFSKTFKKIIGLSPTEFMDQTVNRENTEEKSYFFD